MIQEEDARNEISINHFLTTETSQVKYQVQFNKNVIFATISQQDLIKSILSCSNDKFSKILTSLPLCIKRGFQDNKKNIGFGPPHVIARDHLTEIRQNPAYKANQEELIVVKCSLDFLSGLDKLIEEGKVAIAYQKRKKAFVFVIDIHEKFASAEYILFTFYLDDRNKNSLKLFMGTMYAVDRFVFEDVMLSKKSYQSLITPPQKQWRAVAVKESSKAEVELPPYQKLSDKLAQSSTVVTQSLSILSIAASEPQLDDNNDWASYLMLFLAGVVSGKFLDPFAWGEQESELHELLAEDLTGLTEYEKKFKALFESCKVLYLSIVKYTDTLKSIKDDSLSVNNVRNEINLEYLKKITTLETYENEFIETTSQFTEFGERLLKKQERVLELGNTGFYAKEMQTLGNIEKVMAACKGHNTAITRLLGNLLLKPIDEMRYNLLRVVNVFLKQANETNVFVALSSKIANQESTSNEFTPDEMKLFDYLTLAKQIRDHIASFSQACDATGNQESLRDFNKMSQKFVEKCPWLKDLLQPLVQSNEQEVPDNNSYKSYR